jgi:hypothetical protein
MELKRVVVTGLGALTPIGNTVPEFWKSLINGVSGAAPITHYDPEKFRTKFACEVKNFNPEDFLEKKEARKLAKELASFDRARRRQLRGGVPITEEQRLIRNQKARERYAKKKLMFAGSLVMLPPDLPGDFPPPSRGFRIARPGPRGGVPRPPSIRSGLANQAM